MLCFVVCCERQQGLSLWLKLSTETWGAEPWSVVTVQVLESQGRPGGFKETLLMRLHNDQVHCVF